jgi:hypothetical protein
MNTPETIKWPPIIRLPRARELRRSQDETEAQICRRRGTLISLDLYDCREGYPCAVGVMAYMADL